MEITKADSYDDLEFKVGSYKVGTLRTSPANLVEKFGEPGLGDDHKTSGAYYLVLTKGKYSERVTIYDYKATSLYNPSDYPSPEDFWASTEEWDFSVGSDASIILLEDLDKFVNPRPIDILVKVHGKV